MTDGVRVSEPSQFMSNDAVGRGAAVHAGVEAVNEPQRTPSPNGWQSVTMPPGQVGYEVVVYTVAPGRRAETMSSQSPARVA